MWTKFVFVKPMKIVILSSHPHHEKFSWSRGGYSVACPILPPPREVLLVSWCLFTIQCLTPSYPHHEKFSWCIFSGYPHPTPTTRSSRGLVVDIQMHTSTPTRRCSFGLLITCKINNTPRDQEIFSWWGKVWTNKISCQTHEVRYSLLPPPPREVLVVDTQGLS